MAVLDFQGEIIAIDLPNPEDTQIYMVTVWLTWKKNLKSWNVMDNAGRALTETAENRQTD